MSIYDIAVAKRDDKLLKLSDYKGKVLLVFNSATWCGFTPQYEAIENLYKKYNSKGLEVLDFPCDQFGHQAPGTDDEIHEFCTAKYKTQFDQFAKIDVNGDNTSEVFKILKEQQPTEEVIVLKNKMAMKAISKISDTCTKKGDIVWNFTKFLVDKEGNAIKRYNPTFNPKDIEKDILELL